MVSNLKIHTQLKQKTKPEIIETVESNYTVARRVYQQLWIHISELFAEFIRSISPLDLQDINEDVKSNGWGIKKITDVNNAQDFISIFQTFYQITGRLLLSNGLLVIPDGDPPSGEDKVNMKSLYDMFRYTNSDGLFYMLFLGILQYYFEKYDFSLIKKALTEV